ncbi:hypothetical protein D3C87_1932780 [compost metagenome]
MRQIESYNAHALEAFTVGTVLYLLTGVFMGLLLGKLGPSCAKRIQRAPKITIATGSENA